MSHVDRSHLAEVPPPDEDWNPTDDDAPDAPPRDDAKKEPSPLETRWIQLGEASQLLIDDPPPQDWLLTRWADRRDQGVFPRGRTGLVAATGGTGKTMALIQLAIAVATGGHWLGRFRAAQGNVLLALAEEDLDEAHRRLWRACNALELSRDEREAVAERIDLLPLAGVPVALTASPAPGIVTPTQLAVELHQRLEARDVDWAVVILDPLSRWAGGGVEANNDVATRFVQIVETLTTVRGAPSVLVAHHSSKTSAKDGESDARGVTGIRDGFRWMVSLDAVEAPDGSRAVRLRNGKSNYSMTFDDVLLMRNDEPGAEGTLRPAADDEADRFALTPGDARAQLQQEREEYQRERATAKVIGAAANVAVVLATNPGIVTRELESTVMALTPGIGRDAVRTGLSKLGASLIRVDGERRALKHYLDGSKLPGDILTWLEEHRASDVPRVLASRSPQ